MNELKELRLNDNRLVLKDNIVTTPILPRGYKELDRDVSVQGESIVEGPLYAKTLEVANGPLSVRGAVFTQSEIHVNIDAAGTIEFQKSVGSAGSIVCQSRKGRVLFGADINAKSVTLRNCYVAANVFGDEVVLEDCVVLGGVFAVRTLSLTNVVIGTFNAPAVKAARDVNLLLPSAFSVEPVAMLPGTSFRCLSLVDLSALMRGVPEKDRTGSVSIDPEREAQRSVLVDDAGNTQVLRSYSVVGKVLAADLVDMEKLQNHFLLAAGSLGSQVLRTYDLGNDSQGKVVSLTPANIADFFFRLLDGRVKPREMNASFSISEVMDAFGSPKENMPPKPPAAPKPAPSAPPPVSPVPKPAAASAAPAPGPAAAPKPAPSAPPPVSPVPKPAAASAAPAPGPAAAPKPPTRDAVVPADEGDGDKRFCDNCGAVVAEDAKFCKNCGATFD